MTRPLTQREIADLEWRMDRELAITVPCPMCKARVDEPCWNTELGTDLRAPAHWQRLKQAREEAGR